MHVPINVKSPNNISEWQMGFNSAFKGLTVMGIPEAEDSFQNCGSEINSNVVNNRSPTELGDCH